RASLLGEDDHARDCGGPRCARWHRTPSASARSNATRRAALLARGTGGHAGRRANELDPCDPRAGSPMSTEPDLDEALASLASSLDRFDEPGRELGLDRLCQRLFEDAPRRPRVGRFELLEKLGE